jgi:hypothetical protein
MCFEAAQSRYASARDVRPCATNSARRKAVIPRHANGVPSGPTKDVPEAVRWEAAAATPTAIASVTPSNAGWILTA